MELIKGKNIPGRNTHVKPGLKTFKFLKANYGLYLMAVPGIVFLLVFKYTPMYGLLIAFQDFSIFKGISGSQWIGMQNFNKLFHAQDFYMVFRNTLYISLYKIVLLFPIPIVIAVLLNEIRNMVYKKTVQTIIYLPHFLSWVIIGGLFINILSASGGMVNQLITFLGGQPISFLTDNHFFRGVLVVSAGWKEVGWNAIIYIAAIAGVDQEIYEAAKIDGAGRIMQIRHITIPSIASTIILMLILRIGHVMDAGTEQILMMYNPAVYQSGDVIGTYVYRIGLGQMNYSFSTAVGLFNSIIGFLLLIIGNTLSKKVTERSIW